MQEEHRPTVGVTVHLGGKSPAVGRPHRVLQDRPLPVRAANFIWRRVASSMPPPARQRKRPGPATGSRLSCQAGPACNRRRQAGCVNAALTASLPVASHAIDPCAQSRIIHPQGDHGADTGRGPDAVPRVSGTECLDLAGRGAQRQAASVEHRRFRSRPRSYLRLVWHRAPPRL